MRLLVFACLCVAAVFLQGCYPPRSPKLRADNNLYGAVRGPCGSLMCDKRFPGVHAICITMPSDFCMETEQPDWCSAESGQLHCVPLHAWSLYVKGGNVAPAVTCSAIPRRVLTDVHIEDVKTWNGKEFEPPEVDGLQKLFDKCNTGPKAHAFKSAFCEFVIKSKKLSVQQASALAKHASCHVSAH